MKKRVAPTLNEVLGAFLRLHFKGRPAIVIPMPETTDGVVKLLKVAAESDDVCREELPIEADTLTAHMLIIPCVNVISAENLFVTIPDEGERDGFFAMLWTGTELSGP